MFIKSRDIWEIVVYNRPVKLASNFVIYRDTALVLPKGL